MKTIKVRHNKIIYTIDNFYEDQNKFLLYSLNKGIVSIFNIRNKSKHEEYFNKIPFDIRLKLLKELQRNNFIYYKYNLLQQIKFKKDIDIEIDLNYKDNEHYAYIGKHFRLYNIIKRGLVNFDINNIDKPISSKDIDRYLVLGKCSNEFDELYHFYKKDIYYNINRMDMINDAYLYNIIFLINQSIDNIKTDINKRIYKIPLYIGVDNSYYNKLLEFIIKLNNIVFTNKQKCSFDITLSNF